MIYVCYICHKCGKHMILLIDELESMYGYLACMYCESRDIHPEDPCDTVRDCMKERSYDKRRGIVRQTRYDTCENYSLGMAEHLLLS